MWWLGGASGHEGCPQPGAPPPRPSPTRRPRSTHLSSQPTVEPLRRACVRAQGEAGAGLGHRQCVRGGGPGGYECGRKVARAEARPSARGTRAGCSGGSHGCGHASSAAASTDRQDRAPRAARQRTSREWKGARHGRGRLDALDRQPREGHLDDGHGSTRETWIGRLINDLELDCYTSPVLSKALLTSISQ